MCMAVATSKRCRVWRDSWGAIEWLCPAVLAAPYRTTFVLYLRWCELTIARKAVLCCCFRQFRRPACSVPPELPSRWRTLACSGGAITALHIDAYTPTAHSRGNETEGAQPSSGLLKFAVPCVKEVCAQAQMSWSALAECCRCTHGMKELLRRQS